MARDIYTIGCATRLPLSRCGLFLLEMPQRDSHSRRARSVTRSERSRQSGTIQLRGARQTGEGRAKGAAQVIFTLAPIETPVRQSAPQ